MRAPKDFLNRDGRFTSFREHLPFVCKRITVNRTIFQEFSHSSSFVSLHEVMKAHFHLFDSVIVKCFHSPCRIA